MSTKSWMHTVRLALLALVVCGSWIAHAQLNITDAAGSRLGELILRNSPYAAFNKVTFANTVSSLLGISSSRVVVTYAYPFPVLQLGTTRTGARLQVYDGEGTTGFSQLLRLQDFAQTNFSTIEAITIFLTPAPPPPDDSSNSNQLSTGAIVAIIFGCLLACAFCAILLACCVFALRLVKKFIDSKRHRSHDDFDDDSLDDSSEESEGTDDENGGANAALPLNDSDSSMESLESEVPAADKSSVEDSSSALSDSEQQEAQSSHMPSSDDDDDDGDASATAKAPAPAAASSSASASSKKPDGGAAGSASSSGSASSDEE